MIDIRKIKDEIEKYFHIGFVVKKEDNYISVSPFKSDGRSFRIKIENRNDIRIMLTAEPEKYGASILKLLHDADVQKKENCCRLSSVAKIYINGAEVSVDDFIYAKYDWNNFKIVLETYEIANEDLLIQSVITLISMILSLLDYEICGFEEGEEKTILSKRYERNPINRQICINAKGYRCIVCGFDFQEKYGCVGKNLIEVHHTVPVSKMGENYVVNPITELEPVCSNCHTIIHRKEPQFTIEEVKQMILKNCKK